MPNPVGLNFHGILCFGLCETANYGNLYSVGLEVSLSRIGMIKHWRLTNMRKISKILCIMFILHDALIKFDPINYTKLPEENFKIQT